MAADAKAPLEQRRNYSGVVRGRQSNARALWCCDKPHSNPQNEESIHDTA
jgi:hypothetical protein